MTVPSPAAPDAASRLINASVSCSRIRGNGQRPGCRGRARHRHASLAVLRRPAFRSTIRHARGSRPYSRRAEKGRISLTLLPRSSSWPGPRCKAADRAEIPRRLRELTRQHGVVADLRRGRHRLPRLRRGAQAEYGIRPDLTTLAKIIAARTSSICSISRSQRHPNVSKISIRARSTPTRCRPQLGRGARNRRHNRRLRPRQPLL